MKLLAGVLLGAFGALAATHYAWVNDGSSSPGDGPDCVAKILHVDPIGYRLELWFCWRH